ncbi:MAG: hypothetical protein OSA98_17415 [Rubripirellula sp.]|nr:hypothetical protein [Rubripirellula sp.]
MDRRAKAYHAATGVRWLFPGIRSSLSLERLRSSPLDNGRRYQAASPPQTLADGHGKETYTANNS